MNGKLSLQDLADILSQKANISKKEAELFFKEFFQIILDRIYENDTVKVKDFGTFKLTAISSRESVDVNTGQKIEIPAHYRFTFSPDKVLKELVNGPYSKLQTVLLEDGLQPSDIEFDINPKLEDEDLIADNDVSKVIQEQVKQLQELKQSKYNDSSDSIAISKDIHGLADASSKENSVEDAASDTNDLFIYPDIKLDEEQSSENIVELSDPKSQIKTIQSENNQFLTGLESDELNPDADQVSQSIETSFGYDDSDDLIDIETSSVAEAAESEIDLDTTFLTPVENLASDSSQTNESATIDEEQVEDIMSIENHNTQTVASNNMEDTSDRPLVPEGVAERESEEIKPLINNVDSSMQTEEQIKGDFLDDSAINQEFYREENDWNKTSNLRSRILIIVLAILVAFFVVKEFFKLFDVKSDYEKYMNLGTKNLVMEDTMPYLLDADDLNAPLAIGIDGDSLSSTNSDSIVVTADVMVGNVTTHPVDSIVVPKQTIIADQDLSNETSLMAKAVVPKPKRLSRKVSDNLSVNTVNKAQLFVLNNLTLNQGQEEMLPSAETQAKKVVDNKIIKVVEPEAEKKIVAVEKPTVKQSTVPKEVKKDPEVKIDRGMTLRSLATKYYGNAIYWVYIYSANKEKLPKPDNVPAGLALSIPSLTQFGVTTPTDIKQIEKAKKLESQILKR